MPSVADNELAYLRELLDMPTAGINDLRAEYYARGVAGTLPGGSGGEGEPGAPGKSAYQEWLDLGNVGTEEDFIESLKGADGVVEDVDVIVAQQFATYHATPEIWADSPTTVPNRVLPSGYSGKVRWVTTDYAGHPGPGGKQVTGDTWKRRNAVA